MTRNAVVWIAVIAACFFMLGFLTSRYVFTDEEGAQPSYLDRLALDLGLTQEQKERVGLILEDEDKKIAAIMNDVRNPVAEKIQAVRDGAREEIRGLLDESQLEIFDKGGYFSD